MNAVNIISSYEGLYSSRHIQAHLLPEDKLLIVNKDSNRPLIVPSWVLSLIDICRQPRTAGGHYLAARNHFGFAQGIRLGLDRMLLQLIDTGVLSLTDILPETSTDCSHAIGEIRTGVVVTADRPYQCAETVKLCASALSVDGNPSRIVVVDGSREETSQEILKALLVDVSRITGARLDYYGSHARTEYCNRLVRMGFSQELCTWLLQESLGIFSAGSARNLGLLVTAGNPVLFIDDDVELRAFQYVGSSGELYCVGHQRPRHFKAFHSRDQAIASSTTCDIQEMLSAVLKLLGNNFGSLCRTWNQDVNLERACSHQYEALSGVNSHIPFVQLGVVGDSAMHSGDWIGMMGADVQEQLHASDSMHKTSRESREVTNIAPGYTVTHESACMAFALAVDNSSWLPPFMPMHRNEDGVFGCLIGACCPTYLYGHIPYGVLHAAPQPRSYNSGVLIRVSDLIMSAIRDVAPQLISGRAANLYFVGQYFMLLASCDNVAIISALKRWAAETYTARLAFIAKALQGRRRDSQWKAHMLWLRMETEAQLTKAEYYVPREWVELGDEKQCIATSRHFFRLFGEALQQWSLLRTAAQQICDS